MKIPKLIALAVITLMAVGAMGSASTQVLAQSPKPVALQSQSVQAADPETVAGPDLDQVQQQVGDQAGPDAAADTKGAASEAPGIESQDPAPSGAPAVSADAALKAAQGSLKSTASGTAALEDENGKLIYSVDLNGSDVKVDALTGTVLGVDQAGVDQGGDVQSGSNN